MFIDLHAADAGLQPPYPGPFVGAVDLTDDDLPCGEYPAVLPETPGNEAPTEYAPPILYPRGDVNADGIVDISEASYELNFLCLRGAPFPCNATADANFDHATDTSDSSWTLNFRLLGGPPPPSPYPVCGFSLDPKQLLLGCVDSKGCTELDRGD